MKVLSMTYKYGIDIIRDRIKIGEFRSTSCSIKFDSTAEVMRSIKFDASKDNIVMNGIEEAISQIYFDGSRFFDGTWCFADHKYSITHMIIDLFTDRFRPYIEIDGTFHYLGYYMAMSAPETLSETGSEYSIEAYDETMILKQAKLDSRKLFSAGSAYTTAIERLLVECGFENIFSDPSTGALQTDREFETGTSYLEVINTLLAEINFNDVHINSDGYVYLTKIASKHEPDFVYSDKKDFKLISKISKDDDIYDLPNVLIGTVSNPDISDTIIYKKENNDPSSRISILKRGYKVVKVYSLSNIASESDLQDYIDQKYLESMQTTESVSIETIAEPEHEFGDYVQLSTDLISGLYQEKSWDMTLGTNGTMKHTLERKVFI